MALLNRLLATLLGLVLLVAGVVALIEIVAATGGSHNVIVPYTHWWHDALDAHWSTRGVRLIALVALVAGAALLLVELRPRGPRDLPLRSRGEGLETAVERRAVEKTLRAAALEVDGVGACAARIRRGRATLQIRTDELRDADLEERVTTAATERLDGFGLQEPLPLRISLVPRGAS